MIFILLLAFFAIFLFHELYWKRRNLPPGPTPLPFLGNMLQMSNPNPGYQAFLNWTKKYGSVFTVWLGMDPYVIITSYDLLKETFIKDGDTYVNKPGNPLQRKLRGGDYGVLDTNGEVWRDQRRFALTQLRDLGLGKDLMQEKILIEVEELQKELDQVVGQDIDLPTFIDKSVGNVINLTLFGYRFEKERAQEFRDLKELIDSQRKILSQFWYFIQFRISFLEMIMPGKSLTELVVGKRHELDKFYMKQIEEHRKIVDYDEVENSDFVEAYLKEQRRRGLEGDVHGFDNKQLTAMCFDLWLAGLVTTTITLTWGVSFYLHDDKVKEKILEELDRVIGEDRLITTADKNDLPYMTAFLNETQRCTNLLPTNLPHQTTRDTTIDGFFVKKGTRIIAQMSSVMLDEKVFPDPFKFNPDRFIENGKLKKVDELIPFSIGKRQCLGEGLARMELFLFFANLYHRYEITPGSTGLPDIDKSKTTGIVLPREFNAILRKRHN